MRTLLLNHWQKGEKNEDIKPQPVLLTGKKYHTIQ
jgi:hypothetical protein